MKVFSSNLTQMFTLRLKNAMCLALISLVHVQGQGHLKVTVINEAMNHIQR